MQEVQLDKNVKLLDCPGVVMLKSGESNASVALLNCKGIEKCDDLVGPVKEILKLCPAKMLVTLYKLPTFDYVDDFLQKVSAIRGKLKKGGIVDVNTAAKIVLHDWNEGKIPYYTMPLIRDADVPSEVKIVTELSKEFNVDEIYGYQVLIYWHKSVDDFNPVEVPSNTVAIAAGVALIFIAGALSVVLQVGKKPTPIQIHGQLNLQAMTCSEVSAEILVR